MDLMSSNGLLIDCGTFPEPAAKRGDFYVMQIKPEAGGVKTGEARTVPIHEHIIEQGFIEFVQSRGKGPLFYNKSTKASEGNPLRPTRSRAVKAREHTLSSVGA